MTKASPRRLRRNQERKAAVAARKMEGVLEAHREVLDELKGHLGRTENTLKLLLSARSALLGGTKLDGENVEDRVLPYEPGDLDQAGRIEKVVNDVQESLVEAKLEYAEAILDYVDGVDAVMEAIHNPPVITPATPEDVAVAEASRE